MRFVFVPVSSGMDKFSPPCPHYIKCQLKKLGDHIAFPRNGKMHSVYSDIEPVYNGGGFFKFTVYRDLEIPDKIKPFKILITIVDLTPYT